jgi:ribonuclease HII
VHVVGVDENGLGPRLGPLVATAVTIEVPCYDRARLHGAGERLGIDDSKATSGFGKMAAAEGLALAMLEQVYGQAPADADALLGLIALDGVLGLRMPCPSSSLPQCWSAELRLPVFGGDIEQGRAALARLLRRKVRIVAARTTLACAFVLNAEVQRLGSRTAVDLSLFERLVLDARAQSGQDVEAILGMVSGIRDYPRYFDRLRGRQIETVHQDRKLASYRVAGVGALSFEVDADARHLPVALASMLGKYVRELSMERQNRFYASHDPSLARPSGYHDPVTRGFVAASAPLRRRLGIIDQCFER